MVGDRRGHRWSCNKSFFFFFSNQFHKCSCKSNIISTAHLYVMGRHRTNSEIPWIFPNTLFFSLSLKESKWVITGNINMSKRSLLSPPFQSFKTVALKLQLLSESPGRLVKTQTAAPYPQLLSQQVGGNAWEFAFLISSQLMLTLLVWELYFENCYLKAILHN